LIKKGNWTFGEADIGISCLAKVPAITTKNAIVNVVLALLRAKSTIDVMNY